MAKCSTESSSDKEGNNVLVVTNKGPKALETSQQVLKQLKEDGCDLVSINHHQTTGIANYIRQSLTDRKFGLEFGREDDPPTYPAQ